MTDNDPVDGTANGALRRAARVAIDPVARRTAIRDALLAGARGLMFAVLSQTANIALFVMTVVSIALIGAGPGLLLFPVALTAVRAFANLRRRVAGAWCGVEIPVPYRPRPERVGSGFRGALRWLRWRFGALAEPATWRDLLWLLCEVPVGLVLGLLPACLLVYGVEGVLVVPVMVVAGVDWFGYGAIWPVDSPLLLPMVVPQGVVILLIGIAAGPRILRLHAEFARLLLAPTRSARLAHRVRQLSDSRAVAVDAQAAELRRIERDLHDGAQARLVALGMSIGLAEQLVASDPQAALRLLGEARQASGKALAELRDLVRGIHPPVLAERGLHGAVSELALVAPLPVAVDVQLSGRAQPPVEAAAYFAVAETLANTAKHGGARNAWIRIRHAAGVLSIVVGDDGVGGADPARGSGLRGISNRLAAFDGTMTVSSPPGGPTTVTMELPCALSSPKT